MYYVSALIGERDVRALSGEIGDRSDASNVRTAVSIVAITLDALSYEYSWCAMRTVMNGLNVLMMGTEQFSKIEPAAMIFTANLSAPASSRKCSDNFPHPNHSIHLTGVLSFLAS